MMAMLLPLQMSAALQQRLQEQQSLFIPFSTKELELNDVDSNANNTNTTIVIVTDNASIPSKSVSMSSPLNEIPPLSRHGKHPSYMSSRQKQQNQRKIEEQNGRNRFGQRRSSLLSHQNSMENEVAQMEKKLHMTSATTDKMFMGYSSDMMDPCSSPTAIATIPVKFEPRWSTTTALMKKKIPGNFNKNNISIHAFETPSLLDDTYYINNTEVSSPKKIVSSRSKCRWGDVDSTTGSGTALTACLGMKALRRNSFDDDVPLPATNIRRCRSNDFESHSNDSDYCNLSPTASRAQVTSSAARFHPHSPFNDYTSPRSMKKPVRKNGSGNLTDLVTSSKSLPSSSQQTKTTITVPTKSLSTSVKPSMTKAATMDLIHGILSLQLIDDDDDDHDGQIVRSYEDNYVVQQQDVLK